MAISRCSEIVISRKKFSDFDLIDPTTKEECENLYLAGYTEDENGHRENVKLKAISFINASLGSVIGNLDPDKPNDIISISNERVDGKVIRVANINYSNTNFVQINKVDESLFYNFNGTEYLCIRLSANTPLGTVIKMYLPNFPQNKGVLLFPSSSLLAAEDTPKEVFYNDEVVAQIASDYYFTLIQLADPQDVSATNIQTKTKVIEVNNITSDN